MVPTVPVYTRLSPTIFAIIFWNLKTYSYSQLATLLKNETPVQVSSCHVCVVFQKKKKQSFADVLRSRFSWKFANFTGKRLCWSFFIIRDFPVKFAKFLITPLQTEHHWRMLLKKLFSSSFLSTTSGWQYF